MKIIVENGLQKLIPSDENKKLISKEDLAKPEEERYYFEFAYIPVNVTLAKCEELYEEVQL